MTGSPTHAFAGARTSAPALGGLLCGVLACWAAPAPAQGVPPDAGQLQREAERAVSRPAQPPPPPASPVDASDDGDLAFTIDRFVVEGAQLVPAEALERRLDGYRGRPLVFAELDAALQTLVAHYRALGWFARVQIPEQDITDGVLRMRVVEGRFGDLQVHADGRARGDFIAAVVRGRLQPGAPYELSALERGMLLANDLPGIRVDGVLQAGTGPGRSDLVLQVEDLQLLSGSLSLGNDGSRYTGRTQGIGRLHLNNPSGYGDQVGITAMRGNDLDYRGASYSLPLGSRGLRGNLGYTALRYRLGKEFSLLDAIGSSRMHKAGVSYPVARSDSFNLEFELAWARRRQNDDSLGMAIRRRDVDDLTLSVYGDATDGWLGGGWSVWIVDLSRGHARLGLPEDQAYDAAGADVQGGFSLASVELRHERWLSPAWYLRGRLTGQWAGGNLDSSQQFTLGGPFGVRGYPVNEASGDSGAVLQLELHGLLPWTRLGEFDGFAFVDHGTIRRHQDPWTGWNASGVERNRQALSAAGLGVAWSHPRRLSASLALAFPIGARDDGLDESNQDGTRRGSQLWFNLRQRF